MYIALPLFFHSIKTPKEDNPYLQQFTTKRCKIGKEVEIFQWVSEIEVYIYIVVPLMPHNYQLKCNGGLSTTALCSGLKINKN